MTGMSIIGILPRIYIGPWFTLYPDIGGSNFCVTDVEMIETWPSLLSVFP